ncbi:PSAP [Linum grandiflorum]
MDPRAGLFLLLVLAAGSWGCHARQISTAGDVILRISGENQVQGSGIPASEVAMEDQMCTFCQQFSRQALRYLKDNETRTEIVDFLHKTCSYVPYMKKECLSVVDYYVPLFFAQVSAIRPDDLCRKISFCHEGAYIASKVQENTCGICHETVSEVLAKLKNPEVQLEIIELLLKACNSLDSRKAQCKKLVFEYGPLVLTNAEQFLEKTDICAVLHACNNEASPIGVAES